MQKIPDQAITGPAAWVGIDMAKHPEKWLVQLF